MTNGKAWAYFLIPPGSNSGMCAGESLQPSLLGVKKKKKKDDLLLVTWFSFFLPVGVLVL